MWLLKLLRILDLSGGKNYAQLFGMKTNHADLVLMLTRHISPSG